MIIIFIKTLMFMSSSTESKCNQHQSQEHMWCYVNINSTLVLDVLNELLE